MFEGRILKEGLPEDLANDPQVREAYLGENFVYQSIFDKPKKKHYAYNIWAGNFDSKKCISNIDDAKNLIDTNWESYLSTKLTIEEEKLVNQAKILMNGGNEITLKIREACQKNDLENIKFYKKQLNTALNNLKI